AGETGALLITRGTRLRIAVRARALMLFGVLPSAVVLLIRAGVRIGARVSRIALFILVRLARLDVSLTSSLLGFPVAVAFILLCVRVAALALGLIPVVPLVPVVS